MTAAGQLCVGAVVIGRNEGERLERCLRSLFGQVSLLVYVDSGSSDGSVAFARELGVEVLELDLATPFTAARARNEGFRRLTVCDPALELVQFVDGDCEVVEGWLAFARDTLTRNPDLAAVTGIRRERHPERSIYNTLCDIEWQQGPFGETKHFGGDVMVRVQAFSAVGGYNPRVIAAEDDELSSRICLNGGRILRVARTMTLHDANMHHLSQWWQRAKRCGHGFAEVGKLHGAPPLEKFKDERKRALIWRVALPAVLLLLAPPTLGATLLLSAVYPLRALRVAYRSHGKGMSLRESCIWGLSCAFSSFPEAIGIARYHVSQLQQRAPQIIEYKSSEAQ